MRIVLFLGAILISLSAHSLNVFSKEDGGFVVIKSYFYGNSPCKECDVKLLSLQTGEVLASGKTDLSGEVRIKIPAKEFEILVDGSLAHEKRVKFVASGDGDEANAPNEQASEQDGFDFWLKMVFALIIIGAVFGAIYALKRIKNRPN